VTSDFRSEVESWPFRACAMKNMQYFLLTIVTFLIIVFLAMGQIPRSTERIFSLGKDFQMHISTKLCSKFC